MEDKKAGSLTKQELIKRNEELEERLKVAEETLRAIREGEVDAVIVSGSKGEQIFALDDVHDIYRLMVETMNEAGLAVTPDGTVLFANNCLARMLKMPLEQVVGQQLSRFVHPDSRAALDDVIAASSVCSADCRLNFVASDGTAIPVHVWANRLDRPDGPTICLVGVDLTQLETSKEMILHLQEQQNALRESEERLRLAQGSANVGVWDWKIDTGTLDFTPELNHLYGLPSGTIKVYQDWRNLVHPDDIGRIETERDKAIANHQHFDLEFRGRHASGEYRWISTKGGAVYNETGKAVRVFGVNIDITDRKRAEESLARVHKQLQDIIDNTPDIIYAFDLEGRFLMANTAVADLLKSTPEQIIGKRRHEFMPREDADWHEANDRKVLEAGKAIEFEESSQLPGRSITWLTTKFPLLDAQGRIYAVAGISADITERKRAEEVQTRSLAKIKDVNRELSEFAHAVSHDLKSPLRAVSVLADLIGKDCRDTLGPEERHNLDLMKDRVKHMQRLIDGVLEFSRLGRVEGTETLTDLGSVALRAIDLVAPPAGIRISLETDLPAVVCEPIRIQQVFQNLIGNAVKHMERPEGEVRVGCAPENGGWRFYVRDNGPGIDERHHERIFKIFQTLKPKGETGGTGIGLSIVRRIVESHGGRVWVESKVGDGSTFFFTIPRKADTMPLDPKAGISEQT